MADWSQLEVELIVADYFEMLNLELSGITFNKSAHRRELLKVIKRTDTAIERKHQNISAILIKYGTPYIDGYKPLWGFQQLTEEVVLDYIATHPKLESKFDTFANKGIDVIDKGVNFKRLIVEAPSKHKIKEVDRPKSFSPVKRNYLEIEQRNRATGQNGEEIVFDYEKWRLKKANLSKLSNKVQWVSRDLGDGTGYDISSFNTKGKEIFIEVKSTKLGIETPIFFSQREYDFSIESKASYFLYRVFDLEKEPKMFIRSGAFDDFCTVKPASYKGFF